MDQATKPKTREKQEFRRVCFTAWEEEPPAFSDKMQYMCYAPELTKKGQHHWQGYVEFKHAQTKTACKKMLGQTTNFRIANGTLAQNEEYCGKAAELIKHGAPKDQGARNDIKKLVEMAQSGCRDIDIINEVPETYLKYHKGVEKVRLASIEIEAQKKRNVSLYVITGVTGIGKTTSIMNQRPGIYSVKDSNGGNCWWCSYKGQRIILFDEFAGQVPCRQMLKICDGWPLELETKGGTGWALWDEVWIVSNRRVNHLWENEKVEVVNAFVRRITEAAEFHPQNYEDWKDGGEFEVGPVIFDIPERYTLETVARKLDFTPRRAIGRSFSSATTVETK